MMRRTYPILSFVVLSLACGSPDGPATVPSEGALAVSVIGTGNDRPALWVARAAGLDLSVPDQGFQVLGGVAAGTYLAELLGVPANCSVEGGNPLEATVEGGDSASVVFRTRCVARSGAVRVALVEDGDGTDADGYEVQVADKSARIVAGGSVLLEGLPEGRLDVRLLDADLRCTPHPLALSVDVAPFATVDVEFRVTCRSHPAAVAFVGVDVLPMTGAGTLRDQTVLVRDGVVAAVGPRATVVVPADALVVDGAGLYLMPGLTDMHTHLGSSWTEFTNTVPPEGPLQKMTEGQLLLYLANGVTTILNAGDFNEPELRWRDEVRAGRYPGPTMYVALYARGGPGTPDYGPPLQPWSGPGSGRAYAEFAAARGYDFLKVYNYTPRDVLPALIGRARELGIPTIGHIPLTMTLEEVLDAGLIMVAHSDAFWWSYFHYIIDESRVPEAVSLIRDAGAWVTTGVGIVQTIAEIFGGNTAGIAAFWARPETVYMHWTERALHEEGIQGPRWNPPGARPGLLNPGHAFVFRYTRAMLDGGVRFLSGTDSPTVLGVAGFSTLFELETMERALGMSRYEVLRVATRNGGDFIAEQIGPADAFGTVEVGKRADLLLLEADPLDDLGNLARRAAVMARGRLYLEAELQRGLEELRIRYGN